MSNGLRI